VESGSDRAREAFTQLLRQRVPRSTPEKPRWGLHWPWLWDNRQIVAQWESLWPDTRWIIAVSHPLAAIEAAKGSCLPSLNIPRAARDWVQACKFVASHARDRVALVPWDRLENASYLKRRNAVDGILRCVGESLDGSTEGFFRGWPEAPRSRRRFLLSDEAKESLAEEVPGLTHYMQRMGYLAPWRAALAD
jgi:hypothetical protein